MDRLTAWHRWVGLALFWVVLLHAMFVTLGFAALDRRSPLRTFLPLAGQVSTLLGITAPTVLVAATAKAAGAGSAGLRQIPEGSRVFAEGPYGAFTAMNRAKHATLLIAGGIGVTAIRSLMEDLDGPVTVLYRVRTEADAVLLSELRALASARGAQVHVLAGRTGDGPQPFAPENLVALVPDVAVRDVYVCGPPAMTSAVLRSLRQLKIPARQVHAERFVLVT